MAPACRFREAAPGRLSPLPVRPSACFYQFARPFARQLPTGALELAEMRARSIILIAKLPARESRESSFPERYAVSAQLAIEQTVDAARFGYCCNASLDIHMPLPEPVCIKVELVLTPS